MANTLTKKNIRVIVPERLRLQTSKPTTAELQTAIDSALREVKTSIDQLRAAVVELQDIVEDL